jgi:hypothetical protein
MNIPNVHLVKSMRDVAFAGVYGSSRANSCVNSRVGSRENLCEECIQNPLDLIDASIQVSAAQFPVKANKHFS